MKRPLTFVVSFACALMGVRLLWACLDVTPLVVVRDVSVQDAGCRLCVERPENCADIITACNDDPRCKPAYACIVTQECLDTPTLDDKIKCGLPCAAEAGIEDINDPVIATHLVGLVACGQVKCAEPCNLQDATLGL